MWNNASKQVALSTGTGFSAATQWQSIPFYGSLTDAVADVKKGTKLTVLAHEGTWLKVSVDGKQGYVSEKVVSTAKVDGDMGRFIRMLPITGSTEFAALLTALSERTEY